LCADFSLGWVQFICTVTRKLSVSLYVFVHHFIWWNS
jgi:hypothetical protein